MHDNIEISIEPHNEEAIALEFESNRYHEEMAAMYNYYYAEEESCSP